MVKWTGVLLYNLNATNEWILGMAYNFAVHIGNALSLRRFHNTIKPAKEWSNDILHPVNFFILYHGGSGMLGKPEYPGKNPTALATFLTLGSASLGFEHRLLRHCGL